MSLGNAIIGCIRQYNIFRGLIRQNYLKSNLLKMYYCLIRFNLYIIKNLANCAPLRDTSIFRFELDCTCTSVYIKEYILYISDGQSPPSLSVVRRKHSPNLSPLCLQYLTKPVRLYKTADRAGRERLGECFLRTTKGGTDLSITNIM